MFNRVVEWLEAEPQDGAHRFGTIDVRMATAALFHHVVSADGVMTTMERAWLQSVLKDRFGLDDEECRTLMEAAGDSDAASPALFPFTAILNRELDETGRRAVMSKLMELAFADGRVGPSQAAELERIKALLKLA